MLTSKNEKEATVDSVQTVTEEGHLRVVDQRSKDHIDPCYSECLLHTTIINQELVRIAESQAQPDIQYQKLHF